MEEYNLNFNNIIDEDKFTKIYLEHYQRDINKINSFGIAKATSYSKHYQRDINTINSFGIAKVKEILDGKSIGSIDAAYVGEPAVFVPMDYYCVINPEENAFTCGIGSCCGLVIFNGNDKFLMHISPKHSTDEILNLLGLLNLSNNGEVYIFPGNICEFGRGGNQIDYEHLSNKLESLNNKVYVRKFNSISGGVYLLDDKLIIWDEEPYYIKNSNCIKK